MARLEQPGTGSGGKPSLLSVIDTLTNSEVATIPIGTNPAVGVAIHPSGSFVYVTNQFEGKVRIVDTVTNSVVGSIQVGNDPLGIAVHPSGRFVYAVNNGSNSVSVIDTSTNTVVSTVPVGKSPFPFGQFIIAPPVPTEFCPTGSMNVARFEHTATLLPSGKVLVAGGSSLSQGPNAVASAELYDRSTGVWIFTGPMNTPRKIHTATLLNNGKVLVVGGLDLADNLLASAELYDPTTGIWSPTGSMSTPRIGHTATLLSSGKILVAGGRPGSFSVTTSAELYDPNTGIFTPTGSLNRQEKRGQVCCWLLGTPSSCRASPATFFLLFQSSSRRWNGKLGWESQSGRWCASKDVMGSRDPAVVRHSCSCP